MSIENPLQDILGVSIPAGYRQAADTENINALTRGKNIENQYTPEKYRLANENQMNINKYYAPNIMSEINNRNALTQKYNTMTPLEAAHQQLENEWYGRKAQADVNYKNMGGGRASTGSKDDYIFQQNVAKDNPSFTDEQNAQAREAFANGETTLPDGTSFNISRDTRRAYDRAFKSTTTSPLITAGVRANAAEVEMPVLDKYISEGRKPYGTTIFGKSPQQIKDALNVDDIKAQNRLGDYIASDVLAFDKAALQTRIAGTESGVTIINEVMSKAKQTIDAKYPTLSDAARQRALERVGHALSEALQARNKYGLGASGAAGKPAQKLEDPLGIR
jgi:hypothetical protein